MAQDSIMWGVILLVYLCGLVQGMTRIDPLVSTKRGLIRGLRSDDGNAKFLGVPYGMVNHSNPFGPSVPHPGFDGVYEAYESNFCPQGTPDFAMGTLDCLTMDIHVPNVANSQNRLPVMVWVHGGGFVAGSASSDGMDPIFLLKHDVIVVAINYRLGLHGFMCLGIPEVPGNQGLKDQVLALRWINENIEAFGGDAKQITLFGQSAGGMSVNLHLLSSYEQLFNKAIIQSGPANSPMIITEPDITIPSTIAKALGFETDDARKALEFLASVDALMLVKVAQGLITTNAQSFDDFFTKPCIEKELEGIENFITDHPINIKSLKASTIPILIGSNNDEYPYLDFNGEEYLSLYNFDVVKIAFNLEGNEDAVDFIRHFYIGDEKYDENVGRQISYFAADFMMSHPTQVMAQRFLEIGAKTVYRYMFSYVGARSAFGLNMPSVGAVHSDELGYLFNFDSFSEEIIPEDRLVIDRMTKLWTNFAKFGNPTPEISDLLPFKWEPITKTTQPYLSIDSEWTLKARPFHDRMAFWDLFNKKYSDQFKWAKGKK